MRPGSSFQSTPAHQDGRNRRWQPRWNARTCFNPLPPTRTGETREATLLSLVRVFQSTPAHQDGRNAPPALAGFQILFQSTPAHQDGRNSWLSLQCSARAVFQSTPAHQDGRNMTFPDSGTAPVFQSTPAHQDGRNAEIPKSLMGCLGFNPLPPTRTGETLATFSRFAASCVSIHSRPPGREKPDRGVQVTTAGFVSIHSRPPGREKRREAHSAA